MADKKYIVYCKYCGNEQEWSLADLQAINSDITDLYSALKYDQEYSCDKCGCWVRLSEALEQEVLNSEGYGYC